LGAPVLSEVQGPSISRQDAWLALLPELALATSYRVSGLVLRRILPVRSSIAE